MGVCAHNNDPFFKLKIDVDCFEIFVVHHSVDGVGVVVLFSFHLN